ncbi:hypothetical protein [Reyranella sp.]|nr:hypothetical protein [Reyranella sp.]
MRHSSFGALVLFILLVVVAVLLLTPHQRRSPSTVEVPLWGTRP